MNAPIGADYDPRAPWNEQKPYYDRVEAEIHLTYYDPEGENGTEEDRKVIVSIETPYDADGEISGTDEDLEILIKEAIEEDILPALKAAGKAPDDWELTEWTLI